MIKRFNQQQIVYGCLRLSLAFVIFWIIFVCLRLFTHYLCESFDITLPASLYTLIPLGCLCLIILSGFRRWKSGQGHYTLAESSIPDMPEHRGLMMNVANKDLIRHAAGNYLITTFLLAGPIQMMQAYDHFRSTIPDEHNLESRIISLLSDLLEINAWQHFHEHPGKERELIFLINMGKVEYSPAKGRIKASS